MNESQFVAESDFGIPTQKTKKPLLTPSPEMVEIADAIQRRLAVEPMLKEYGMRLAPKCYKTYTIVAKFLAACCVELSRRSVENINATLDVMGLVTMTRSGRFTGAEKGGNLDPVFYAGERAKRIVHGEPFFNEGEEFFPTDANGNVDTTSEEYRTALAIQSMTAKNLLPFEIVLKASDFRIWTIAAAYIKCAIEEVYDRATASPFGQAEFIIYELMDVMVKINKDDVIVKFQTGADARQIIKSDANTENR